MNNVTRGSYFDGVFRKGGRASQESMKKSDDDATFAVSSFSSFVPSAQPLLSAINTDLAVSSGHIPNHNSYLKRVIDVISIVVWIFLFKIRTFALAKPIRTPKKDKSEKNGNIACQQSNGTRITDYILYFFRCFLIALGCLERPLGSGLIRLRWQCVSILATICNRQWCKF